MNLLGLYLNLLVVSSPFSGPDPSMPVTPLAPDYYQVQLLPKIAEAKKLVAKEAVRVKWCSQRMTTVKRIGKKTIRQCKNVRYVCGREHALAVLNVKTGKIKILRVGVMNRGEVKEAGGFIITRLTENGVNSEYKIQDNDWIVVALKTMAGDPSRRGSFKSAVYVPYSAGLNTPDMRLHGMKYLIKQINLAYATLDKRKVTSSVHESSDVLISNLIPSETILTLLLIEHMDPDEFRSLGAEKMIARVLTTVGVNGLNAYRFAFSYAGAGGLAQFIPTTYADISRRYTKARLHRNFISGMSDHLNAIMAQVCLADRDVVKLIYASSDRTDELENMEVTTCYIAAAYNGGPERAIRSCLGDSNLRWKEGSGLASQTVTYVAEFKAVYEYLFSYDDHYE